MRMQKTMSIDWRLPSLAVTLIAPWILSGCGGGGGYDGGDDDPEPAAPTVSLTAPSGGSVNRTVQLTANATAGRGVSRVEFLVDGNVIATDTTAPYSADWNTSTIADGSHSVAARVVDAGNVSATSAAATVTVLNSPTINVAVSSTEVFPRTNSTATGTGQLTW